MNTPLFYRRFLLFVSLVLIITWATGVLPAAEAPKNSGQPAAKCINVSGLLLNKEAGGTWKSVSAGQALASGTVLVGMPRVEIMSLTGDVQLRLLADVGQRGPFPVLESGVILHDPAGVDVDLTPQRGLIVLESLKKSGEAKVRLRVLDEVWVLNLQTPGTKVGLEIFGRHPPGLPRSFDEKTDVPTSDLLLLVLQGQAFLDTGKEGMGMKAPPGVARLHWDNRLREHTFQRLDKLPGDLVKPLDDQETKVFQDISAGTAKLTKGDLGAGLDSLIKSDNKLDRQVGVTMAGAVDDLPRLFGVLMTSTDSATRDHAILVLRHWLGREPGQIKKLEAGLLERKKLTEVQVRNLVHLLLGFTKDERKSPDTFTVLLTYLDHKNQAVRALAYWHLARLAPAGKGIGFDAGASEEQRRQASERWHALIPDGQLPPHPKAAPPAQ